LNEIFTIASRIEDSADEKITDGLNIFFDRLTAFAGKPAPTLGWETPFCPQKSPAGITAGGAFQLAG
jgi:hypothetical protein